MTIYCIHCESPCSDAAAHCPACGHPLAASPVERTTRTRLWIAGFNLAAVALGVLGYQIWIAVPSRLPTGPTAELLNARAAETKPTQVEAPLSAEDEAEAVDVIVAYANKMFAECATPRDAIGVAFFVLGFMTERGLDHDADDQVLANYSRMLLGGVPVMTGATPSTRDLTKNIAALLPDRWLNEWIDATLAQLDVSGPDSLWERSKAFAETDDQRWRLLRAIRNLPPLEAVYNVARDDRRRADAAARFHARAVADYNDAMAHHLKAVRDPRWTTVGAAPRLATIETW